MISFKQFLAEASQYDSLASHSTIKHYRHPEELPIDHGRLGAHHAYNMLAETIANKHPLQKKADGSAAVFIKKEDDGRVGVATKSGENKTPKINYSHEDIERNHGHAPGLCHKLHHLLDHAHKIVGNAKKVSGEFLFTKNEVSDTPNGNKSFKPNTIRNEVSDPEEKEKINKAKIGWAPHSTFNEKGERIPLKDGDVKSHPDVYSMNLDAPKITADEHTHKLMAHLKKTIDDKPKESHEFTAQYAEHWKTYINKTVRDGSTPNTKDFIKHVQEQHQKGIDKVKTPKAKQTKTDAMNADIVHLKANKHHLDNSFKLHHAITAVKNHIVDKLDAEDAKSKVKHYLNGPDGKEQQTGPEGWTYNSTKHPQLNTTKLVRRQAVPGKAAFSAANFNNDRFPAKKAVTESVEKHDVIVPGVRVQPPHKAHDALIEDAVSKAKKLGGTAHVYVTQNKPGDEKNPLSAEDRIAILSKAHAKHIESGHLKLHVGSGMMNNIAHHHAHNPDVTHAHVVLGEDRMNVEDSIKKYNGVADKKGNVPYHYKGGISVEQRAPTSGEHDGIHATEMRNMANSNASDDEKHKYFKDRMNPNVPDNLIHKTIKSIQSVSKKRNESLSYIIKSRLLETLN